MDRLRCPSVLRPGVSQTGRGCVVQPQYSTKQAADRLGNSASRHRCGRGRHRCWSLLPAAASHLIASSGITTHLIRRRSGGTAGPHTDGGGGREDGRPHRHLTRPRSNHGGVMM